MAILGINIYHSDISDIVYYILEETNEKPQVIFKEPIIIEKEDNKKTKKYFLILQFPKIILLMKMEFIV